ncbi:hypothetical protein H1R20_g7188, partial [Candolleomyces eurysporus]
MHCPEVEMRHLPFNSPFTKADNALIETSVDLLEIYSKNVQRLEDDPAVTFKQTLGHEALIEHLESGRPTPLLRILFLGSEAETYTPAILDHGIYEVQKRHPCINPITAQYLVQHLDVSRAFLSYSMNRIWLRSGNYYARRQTESDAKDILDFAEGWYQYGCGVNNFPPSYAWFSYRPDGSTTYIVTDCHANGVQKSILRCISEGFGSALLRPLAIDAFIAEASAEAWSEEILPLRDTLLDYEHLTDKKITMDPSASIRELHVLSCEFLTIREDLSDLIERLEYLLEVYDSLAGFIPRDSIRGTSVAGSLLFLRSQTSARRRWIQSYAESTALQITLFHNLSSQIDNRTNLQIADFTSKIATQTQNDSSSMITYE